MASAGWICVIATPDELLEAISNSTVGAAILTTKGLQTIDPDALRDALAQQAPWSDCPLVLLAPRGYHPTTSRRAIEGFGNVTVLERPLHPSTLVTAVAAALRSRSRQRRTEAFIQQREEAEAKVRSLAATLEARVIARTMELTEALARREAVEEQLRRSEELYRLTIDLSALTPWVATQDFMIVSFGKVPRTPSDGPLERDFSGLNWKNFVHPDDRSETIRTWEIAREKVRPIDGACRMRMPTGLYEWHRCRGSPKLRAGGTLGRWFGAPR